MRFDRPFDSRLDTRFDTRLDTRFDTPFRSDAEHPGALEEIELVGPHLRLGGQVALRRFHRLSDLVNQSQGYILIRNARLLERDGGPTDLVLDELMVNQDEITFIGQGPGAQRTGEVAPSNLTDIDRPTIEKVARRYVIFTPGHTITGTVFVYPNMDLPTFVDTPDPRFVVMVDVTARSLADPRVVSRFDLLLVNRSQMTAAAEASKAEAVRD